mmetsp:Transcript_69114/g.135852  ORF Transcript_69114/g.135852 Transcript_69114/m.135852 type:complete len:242 (-) Transcript_69114:767-1492(-)
MNHRHCILERPPPHVPVKYFPAAAAEMFAKSRNRQPFGLTSGWRREGGTLPDGGWGGARVRAWRETRAGAAQPLQPQSPRTRALSLLMLLLLLLLLLLTLHRIVVVDTVCRACRHRCWRRCSGRWRLVVVEEGGARRPTSWRRRRRRQGGKEGDAEIRSEACAQPRPRGENRGPAGAQREKGAAATKTWRRHQRRPLLRPHRRRSRHLRPRPPPLPPLHPLGPTANARERRGRLPWPRRTR